jgi:hypothetical protein
MEVRLSFYRRGEVAPYLVVPRESIASQWDAMQAAESTMSMKTMDNAFAVVVEPIDGTWRARWDRDQKEWETLSNA